MRALPAWILVAVAACGGGAAMTFRPHSAVARDTTPVVRDAIVAYEGDAATLAKLDGALLGSLLGDAGAIDRARAAAAKAGGSHLVVVDEGSPGWARLHGEATPPPAARRTVLLVVRVPPARWADLPVGLRPDTGRPVVAGPAQPDEPVALRWYCTINGKGTEGSCARTTAECADTYRTLHASDPSMSPCAPASAATCYSAYGPTTEPVTSCHPTIQSCSAHRDLAFVRGDSIGRECALAQ